jgi:hypothetical protein
MTANGKLDSVDTIRNAVSFGTNDRLDAEMLPEQVDYCRRNIPNLTKEAVRKFRGTGVHYYTLRFSYVFGTAADVFVCRFESLTQDWIGFFEAIGAATDELRDCVLRSDKKNTSKHLHYFTYYTPVLAELVRIRDRQLIERFGYPFEQASFV